MSFDPTKATESNALFRGYITMAAIVVAVLGALVIYEQFGQSGDRSDHEMSLEQSATPTSEPGMDFTLPTFPDVERN